MNVLVINSGSSSVKYKLIDMQSDAVLGSGLCERIGLDQPRIVSEHHGRKIVSEDDIKTHLGAIHAIIDLLTHPENGVVKDVSEISAVGHRIAHGGDQFKESVFIDEEVCAVIHECSELAPLHNPYMLDAIVACRAILPEVPMVAVFDTAFHQSLPEHAFIYAIPFDYYIKHRIRKYGFHGTSHKYLAEQASNLIGKPLDALKIITCHLGNGASICAIDKGRSVETSMGFTPAEGLPMGTRCGSIDPLIFKFLQDKTELSVQEVYTMLNKDSGVLGISGISSDFRDLQTASMNGDQRAKLAIDIFCYRVKNIIGSYIAVLNGVDAIVFSGGIGENASNIREQSLADMDWLGIEIDPDLNRQAKGNIEISSKKAKVRTYVIKTDEEISIAKDTALVLGWNFKEN